MAALIPNSKPRAGVGNVYGCEKTVRQFPRIANPNGSMTMNAETPGATHFSERLAEAFRFALAKHNGQPRKGTAIPYLSHPMAVASIVLEYGGSEEQAIGALLHDTVEDCGVSHREIAVRFGETVSRIVKDCTDAESKPGQKKPDWRPRKERYIDHVRREADSRALLVSAADKLHNAHAIVRDVKDHGPETWERFKGKAPSDILWYYESLVSAFRARAAEVSEDFGRLVAAIDAAVKEMRKLVVAAGRQR